jgi:hypothetical protein
MLGNSIPPQKAWRPLLTQIFVNDRKSGAAEQIVASTATL